MLEMLERAQKVIREKSKIYLANMDIDKYQESLIDLGEVNNAINDNMKYELVPNTPRLINICNKYGVTK